MAETLLENLLKCPAKVEPYIGESDPEDHLDAFCNAMIITGCSNAVLCQNFPLTLKKEALRWFKALPPCSVFGWDKLVYQFVQFFITSKKLPRTSHTLALIKQQKDEKLRDFLTCFYQEAVLVPTMENGIVLHLIVAQPSIAMQEFRERSEKYVNLEDTFLLQVGLTD